MKALALKFRRPKNGEFGSHHISDKILYASWHEVEKPINWFIGRDDHASCMLWSSSDLDLITTSISRETQAFLPDPADISISLQLDHASILLHNIYDIGPEVTPFSFVPLSDHISGDDSTKEILVLKKDINEDDLAKELSMFEEITSGDQMHELFEFVASERYEIAGFMCIRRLIADICKKKLRSIEAYEMWRDDYYEELSDSGSLTVSVKQALPSITGSETISWAFGDADKPKLPSYMNCSGIISQVILQNISPYDLHDLDENSIVYMGKLSRMDSSEGYYKNLIVICGDRVMGDTHTGSHEASNIDNHIVFRLSIRNGREIDLCGNVDLSLITKITVEDGRASTRLFTTTDTSYCIEHGSKVIEGLRTKVSHNTPADIPGLLSNVKTAHLGSIMDALEERFDIVLVIPASKECAFDAHADSISTEIPIDMGKLSIFKPIKVTASASGRSQETISSLRVLDSCLSLAVVNNEGFTYISFEQAEKSIISRKAKTSINKDELLDAFSAKLTIVYKYLKPSISEYVRFMTGMPSSQIPFIVKEKTSIDGPSRGGYACARSLEESNLLRKESLGTSNRSFRYSDVDANIPLVAGRYKEYKWFHLACDLYGNAAALKDQLSVSHEKLSLLYCALDEEAKEKAIKSHTVSMLIDTVKTADRGAVEPDYGDKEEELMGKHNMFSVLLGVYLFRATESDAYLDLGYDDSTDKGHLSRVRDNVSSILDGSSYPILTLLRTIYADSQPPT